MGASADLMFTMSEKIKITLLMMLSPKKISSPVALIGGYDTSFGKGLVMDYAGYEYLKGLVETSKQFQS